MSFTHISLAVAGAFLAIDAAVPRSVAQPPGPGATRTIGYYDAALRSVVMIGGTGQATADVRERAWRWTGREWTQIGDEGPSARANAAIAFDEARRRGVVHGGGQRPAAAAGHSVLGDTWSATAGRWQPLTGAELEPRDHHAMIFDPQRKGLILFGGIPGNRSAAWPSHTWALEDDRWVRIATDGPAGRARTGIAYDSRRRQVVLFGGVGAAPGPGQPQPFFGDTWVWEQSKWRKVSDEGPRGRYAHGMTYDESAGVVLLYSGAAAHKGAPLADMWKWDGKRWTEIRLTGPAPGYRYQPVMVYDKARRRTVLYGNADGSQDETWEWDGRRWERMQPR